MNASVPAGLLLLLAATVQAQMAVEVNRPRSPFECSLPNAMRWYGSEDRCLEFLCAGQNVYNEYVFDQDNRRRRNPCYGRSPTEFREPEPSHR